jgi:hypothetical protein
MSIKDHIRPDEEIEACFKNEYVTDRRLIKHHQGHFSEKMEDIDFDHISSISVQRKTSWNIVGAGLAMFFIGAAIEHNPLTALGAVTSIFGLLYRRGEYVLQGDGGETMIVGEHSYLSKIWASNKKDAEEFVDKIRVVKTRDIQENSKEKDDTEQDAEDNEGIVEGD